MKMTALVPSLVILIAAVAACDGPRPAGAQPAAPAGPRHVTVDGHAVMQVRPDLAELTVTIEQQRATPKAAAVALRPVRDGLLARLKGLGIAAADIAISSLQLRPEYRRYPGTGIEGYVAGTTFILTLRKVDRLADVAEAMAVAGATRFFSRYRSSRMPEHKKQVRDLALAAARAKAAQIAREMKVDLGAVLSVTEGGGGAWSGGWSGVANENVNAYKPADRGPGDDDAPALPDALPLSLVVNVSFALR